MKEIAGPTSSSKINLGIIYWLEPIKILWLWLYKFGITSDKASYDIIMTVHWNWKNSLKINAWMNQGTSFTKQTIKYLIYLNDSLNYKSVRFQIYTLVFKIHINSLLYNEGKIIWRWELIFSVTQVYVTFSTKYIIVAITLGAVYMSPASHAGWPD
jgi:hypothetical protein